MTRYAIALGSNQGDRTAHLRQAVDELEDLGAIERISALYETAPVGGPDQGPYLNAVALLDTDLTPEALLAALQGIEARHDRVRAERWGPRTLDLDIVAWEGPPIVTPDLVVPHPRAVERLFVLQPLCDVWPGALVAEGVTAAEARPAVADQEVELLASRWADERGIEGAYRP
jgi:2-amino-4-hydroxy-6-hydroxymethyldihydropteridine diphosphokinase